MGQLETGRRLSGEKPADVPYEQVSRLELVIKLRTDKGLGIMIPRRVLVRADEVIQ